MVNDSYLQHHGILGQKWGVRRYQKLNGTLTPAGKKRLEELRKLDDESYQKTSRLKWTREEERIKNHKSEWKDLNKSGIKENRDGEVTISKKAEITRYANSGEPIDSKRKYVSVTKSDRDNYGGEMLEMLDIDMDKSISQYTYSSNKDLRVANEKMVSEYILNKYGNKKINELYDTSFNKRITDYYMKKNGIDLTKQDKKLLEYTEKGHKKVNDFLEKTMHTKVNDVSDYFSKKGYDALFDVEDRIVAEYPVILLNPDKNIRLKREKVIWNQDDDW